MRIVQRVKQYYGNGYGVVRVSVWMLNSCTICSSNYTSRLRLLTLVMLQ